MRRCSRSPSGLGATVEPCRLPHAPHALSAYYLIAPAEASANLARYDGVRYGLRVDGDGDLVSMYRRTRAAGFGAEVKRRIMLGTYALSSGYYDAYYGTAQKVRTKIAEDFAAAFERFDFVVTPTSPWTAFELGAKAVGSAGDVPQRLLHGADVARRDPRDLDSGGTQRRACRSASSSPGPAFSENALLDAAYALEQALALRPASGAPERTATLASATDSGGRP